MAFDGIVTSNVVAELNTCLIGGKINKVFEPNKNEVILGIYSHGVNYALNFSIASDSYRINLTTHAKPNPLNAPGFCMLLRKHLIGAKIKKIYTIGLERIVYIELECFNELNDLVNKKLIIELMGKHSNIILTNDNNMIIDSLRHLSIEEHSSRDILPAHEYSAPENTKIDFKSIKTFDEFYKLTSNLTNLDAGISKIFIGISKLYIQSIIEDCNIDNAVTTSNLKTVYKYISETIENIGKTNISLKPFKKDFTIAQEKHEDTLQSNFFIDDFYTEKENNLLFLSYRNNILKLVLSTLTKIKKKLLNINSKQADCKNMDTYKLYGELLTANMYQFKEFTENIVKVPNYYNNNELIDIPVDPNKTPSYNAKNYFKKYNKLKNTLLVIAEQKKETESELDYLESIIYELDTAKTIPDIDEIYTEISENPLFERSHLKSNTKVTKQKQKNKKLDKTYTPIEYKIENYTLLVGKNNIQNDYLTTKLAKSTDIWFHTKEIHGSHAILQTHGETPSIDVIIRCAQIAAYYSKAKQSSNVPVDYTLIKYVKKPSGSKPGFVIFTHNNTINVTPKG